MISSAEKFLWCIALTGLMGCHCNAAITVEVFVRTLSGDTVRLSSSPVKVVDAKCLVESISLLDTVDPKRSYDRFFLALSSVKGFEGVFTDATGTALLSGLGAEHFVVVRDKRLVLTTSEQYLWIVPSTEARGGKLLLGNHNVGLDRFREVLKSRPDLERSVVAMLKANANRAIAQKEFAQARLLVSSIFYFVDAENARTAKLEIDRQEATNLRQQAEAALQKKEFDNAYALLQKAQALFPDELVKKLLVELKSKGVGASTGGRLLPEFGWYYLLIKEAMDRAWTQPSQLQGQLNCVVFIRIQRDGTISQVWLDQRSGNSEMDESVLSAVKSVRQIQPLPPGLGDAYVDIPVAFEVKPRGPS
ncbi:MAG: cell envelope integrity protein TolA [Verrucomicrobia bacterium]|nr:cell envelope integrity protein TolA [Verrucomicrobiota bacterium]